MYLRLALNSWYSCLYPLSAWVIDNTKTASRHHLYYREKSEMRRVYPSSEEKCPKQRRSLKWKSQGKHHVPFYCGCHRDTEHCVEFVVGTLSACGVVILRPSRGGRNAFIKQATGACAAKFQMSLLWTEVNEFMLILSGTLTSCLEFLKEKMLVSTVS